ncbi:hypothetical protein [Neobacillus sp. NPDC093127]|uniref:hypothetical protein n=1 Tax=Neobacillus sp. NPDC093127 TaxID=3364296 RepID=UPI00382E312A
MIGYLKQPKDFGLVLSDEDGKYLGVMELGVPQKEKAKVYRSPIASKSEGIAYISSIECRVKYRNLMKSGVLRLPSFVEWV